MDFQKIWNSIVAFFQDGYNLYYVIGGVIVVAAIIVIICVACANSKKKKSALKAEQEKPTENLVTKRTVIDDDDNGALLAEPAKVEAPTVKAFPSAKIAIMTPAETKAKPKKAAVQESKPAEKQKTHAELEAEKAEAEAAAISEGAKRPGVIQIYKDSSDRFRFRVKASNSLIVGHSQGYTTKAACKNGISAIEGLISAETVDTTKEDYKPCIGRPVFEIYKDNEGKFRFRLRAANTNNILASQGYTTKDNCLNGINSIKNIAFNYKLDDTTVAPKEA